MSMISADVERFTQSSHAMLIGDQRVEAIAGATFTSIDPATEDVLATLPAAGPEDVDLAVAAARAALGGPYAAMTPRDRQNALLRLADLIERDADWFAEVDSLDTGKPINEVRYFDIPFSLDVIRYMAGWATKLHGKTIELSFPVTGEQRFHAYTLREPVGVVAQIVPWNFPLMMAVKKVAPALAAGCTVVLKPAEQTPLSALRLGELCQEAGFPPGVVNVITGLGETAGAALAAHPDVDKVAFTGSVEVGKAIVRAAAGNLKRVMLELGGKAPFVVFDDADIEAAAATAAANAYLNQGESCIAAARLYAHEAIHDELTEAIAEHAQALRIGSGLDPETQMGPLVSGEHLDRVSRYLEIGRSEGARVLTGGKRRGELGYFLEPTVIVDASDDMRIVREEIFGPVLTAVRFDDEQAVAAAANALPYGLGASVWTRDAARAQRMARAIKSGMVWVNSYGIADAALPFGGFKQSGWGRETCEENVLDYTEEKVVVEAY